MSFKRSTSVRSSSYGGAIIFGILMSLLLAVILGDLGIVIGIVLTIFLLVGLRQTAKEKIDEFMTPEREQKLFNAHKNSQGFTVKMKHHDSANNPPLSKFLFGNSNTVKYKYKKK